ncbi:type VII toxin-antitoxin system HepT family RNase toxin [Rheinheimera sp. A13L]|uniref:type VII toxin-antitoxin system HepT family RNase toxin n=1 Tax=Rheinheimera sp. A13L TaxID=506534 RepID=UPI00307AE509
MKMGQHLIRLHKLGVPQSSRDVFTLLATADFIPAELADNLKKMIGFRNIALHEYQRLQLAVTEHVIL